MLPISCPNITDINPLQSNQALFRINKLPQLNYFLTEINVPTITINQSKIPTRFTQLNIPGETLNFSDLDITFAVDNNLNNYIAVLNWMKGITFPEDNEQYTKYISETMFDNTSELNNMLSNGVLIILGAGGETNKTIEFTDLSPISLSGFSFDTKSEPNIISCTVTFSYSYFKIV